MNKKYWTKASIFALAAGAMLPQTAAAQDPLRDEILVTGTKKAQAENVQDVPLAVTAYGEDQLDALKVRDLGNLSYKMPNVQLEDIGTSRGVANFSIRGLGINSSIPSIDPAVGTFVDGVYIGQNGGLVLDIFDLESIEVLRGPQGILFGRNVTGGAVLLNTKRPNLDEFEASFKGAVESGLRGTGLSYYAMGSVSGPVVEDTLALKLSAYYNNDNGWQDRDLPGPGRVASICPGPFCGLQGAGFLIASDTAAGSVNHGAAETWMVRPSLLWQPTENFELLLRYEHGDSSGDGASAQNHPGFVQPPFSLILMAPPPPVPSTNFLYSAPKDSFIFSIDEPGFYDFSWDAVTAEINIDVGFGDGRITNVFGWRSTDGSTRGDIDGTPYFLFHAGSLSTYEQLSNEIRYAGRFGDRLDVTVGFYYFTSDQGYQEERYILAGFRRFFGGGLQDSRQYGAFGQLELDLSDNFSLIGGARYTNERKSVELANITLNNFPSTGGYVGPSCSIFDGSCGVDFAETTTWTNITPKAGFQWAPREDLNVYGHWTQGVRSGGYNFRNTSIVFPIARYDEERVETFEVGFKAQPADGRATINAAVFRTSIDDMQREINLADPFAGVVQLIRNTADATIFGIEIEAQYFLCDNLLIMGNLGRLDGEYNSVAFDLNSDGVTNAFDLFLDIPRLAPWSWGAGFIHTLELGDMGSLSTRFSYSHRDANAYTDNNLGVLLGAEILDATIALTTFGDRATISVYGQNLLNEVTHGGETQLPGSLGGGSFAPLNKGRIFGVELQVEM